MLAFKGQGNLGDGQGAYNSQTEEGAIALANDDGNTYHLAASDLGRLLSGQHSLRMVVLNSCEGARASETDLFSSSGASLIRKGIPAVVSMQYEITDRAALEFSRTFYETIAEGIPVDTALQEARKSIEFALKGSLEWGTTMLLNLVRELLSQYEWTPGLPLPVVFNLSSWTHYGKSLPDWLADELSTKYLIPRKIGSEWIKNNRYKAWRITLVSSLTDLQVPL